MSNLDIQMSDIYWTFGYTNIYKSAMDIGAPVSLCLKQHPIEKTYTMEVKPSYCFKLH